MLNYWNTSCPLRTWTIGKHSRRRTWRVRWRIDHAPATCSIPFQSYILDSILLLTRHDGQTTEQKKCNLTMKFQLIKLTRFLHFVSKNNVYFKLRKSIDTYITNTLLHRRQGFELLRITLEFRIFQTFTLIGILWSNIYIYIHILRKKSN